MARKKGVYRKRSIKWALLNEDYSDLTISQIAEVFDVTIGTVANSFRQIYADTGIRVKYTKLDKQGRSLGVCEYSGGDKGGDN